MKMNYHDNQVANASPLASSMVESFRSIGYSIETAIADIIDNSISANASKIWINRIWRGGNSVITIKDNGYGMNEQEIINAMRPGAHNPLAERSKTDLGRFGLGLKTASFSQCRKLTVYSKKEGYEAACWTWDLDYVAETNEWNLVNWMPGDFADDLNDVSSGTLVIWSDLDRVLPAKTQETDISAKTRFSKLLDRVHRHIAMTFHRFIEDRTTQIYWCGHEILPWNPFCIEESKTQEMPTDYFPNGIKVKGYVLPHKNAFSCESAYNKAEGINGWPAHQGFYVYRGKRLLLSGDWLGLFRKEEHYKLVRIQIDIPNTVDGEWQIDIKKSRAYPPVQCRTQLESYAKNVRARGCEVYRHRGKILKQKAGIEFQPLWLEKIKDKKWSFVINRNHDMIKELNGMLHSQPEKAFDSLLRLIEETLPTKTIYINEAKSEVSEKEPFLNQDTSWIFEIIKQMYDNKILSGFTDEQAKCYLKTIEPFNNFEELIESL